MTDDYLTKEIWC